MSFEKSIKKRIKNGVGDDFDALALGLFRYQAKHNKVYKKYLKHVGCDPNQVHEIEQIRFLPIEFFKTQKIICDHVSATQAIYESSGTTGQDTSKHLVADKYYYLRNAQRIFESVYGKVQNFTVLALLPSYLERQNSSLVAMADYFIKLSNSSLSGFFLDDFDKLRQTLNYCLENHQRTLLLGVTFGLLDFAENKSLDLEDQVVVMETGGMKGRRKESTREDVHEVLCSKLGVSEIHSEYGMTELLSQAYSIAKGVFQPSDTLRVYTREISDPFNLDNSLKRGGINVIDLANVDSCAFIETKDLGRVYSNHTFEVLGRLDNTDVRGCNLMV
jgi:phenylacetate-coenzyme A ligase PaaK-like adenylate-forming protein